MSMLQVRFVVFSVIHVIVVLVLFVMILVGWWKLLPTSRK